MTEIPNGYKGKITLARRRYAYRTDSIDPKTNLPLSLSVEKPEAYIPQSWNDIQLKELRAAELSGAIKVQLSDTAYDKVVSEVKSPISPLAAPTVSSNEKFSKDIPGLGRVLQNLNEEEKSVFNTRVDAFSMSEEEMAAQKEPKREPVDWSAKTTPDNDPEWLAKFEKHKPANEETWGRRNHIDTRPDEDIGKKGWDLGPIVAHSLEEETQEYEAESEATSNNQEYKEVQVQDESQEIEGPKPASKKIKISSKDLKKIK